MRITDVNTVLLTGPCTNDPYLSECRQFRSAAFIEIHTDTEHVGLGETYNGYRCAELIPDAVSFFTPILLGQSVDDIPSLFARMYHCENFWCRTGFGLTVLNGIEAALWDLKGKLEGKPVCQLLGGLRHEALDCYATGGPSNYPKEHLARKIDFYLSLGFRAFKIASGSLTQGGDESHDSKHTAADFEADKMQFVRHHIGNEIKVCLDGHMSNGPPADVIWDLEIATSVMEAVEPFDVFFFEEPLHYDDPWGYAELCKRSKVPIAGGECLTGIPEWRVFIEKGSFDVGQPDASYTGGLELCLKVAQLLHEQDRKIATHAWGAGGSFMQNLHLGFAAPNTTILETPPAYGPLHSEIIGDSFVMKEGRALPPDKPGLGITLTDDVKNKYPFIPGSGEFNSVSGKDLAEWEKKVDAQYSH